MLEEFSSVQVAASRAGTMCYDVMIPPRITFTQRAREALIRDPSMLIGRESVTRISTSVNVVWRRTCLYRALHGVNRGTRAPQEDDDVRRKRKTCDRTRDYGLELKQEGAHHSWQNGGREALTSSTTFLAEGRAAKATAAR